MFINEEQALADVIQAKDEGRLPDNLTHTLCLNASTEGIEMEILLRIANILRSGGKEVVFISEEPGKTASEKPGLFSLTIGFGDILD